MTRDEVKKILIVIESTFATFKVENKTQTIDVWYSFLKEIPYEVIDYALKAYIATSGSAFAPSIPQLIAMAKKPKELSQMDEVTAWRLVRNAIRRGLYYFTEEFEKLPPDVQRVVGEASQLRDWAMLESETIDSVIQSNFTKRYQAMQKRQTELEALPDNVRVLIGQIGGNNG